MRNKKLVMAAAVAAMGLSLAACGGSGDSGSSQSSNASGGSGEGFTDVYKRQEQDFPKPAGRHGDGGFGPRGHRPAVCDGHYLQECKSRKGDRS